MTTPNRAFEYYLQGFKEHSHMTPRRNLLAQDMFKAAISEDRKFARAYGHLAYTRLIAWLNGWDPSPTPPKDVRSLADRAVALDPEDYDNLWSQAGVHFYTAKFQAKRAASYKAGISLFDDALALARAKKNAIDHNLLGLQVDKADALFFSADSQEAVDEAIRITNGAISSIAEKHPRRFLWSLGWAQYERAFFTERRNDLLQALETLLCIGNPDGSVQKNLIATYAALGWLKPARRLAADFRGRHPDYTVAIEDRWPYSDAKRLKRWKDHLRKAGLPG